MSLSLETHHRRRHKMTDTAAYQDGVIGHMSAIDTFRKYIDTTRITPASRLLCLGVGEDGGEVAALDFFLGILNPGRPKPKVTAVDVKQPTPAGAACLRQAQADFMRADYGRTTTMRKIIEKTEPAVIICRHPDIVPIIASNATGINYDLLTAVTDWAAYAAELRAQMLITTEHALPYRFMRKELDQLGIGYEANDNNRAYLTIGQAVAPDDMQAMLTGPVTQCNVWPDKYVIKIN